jgi:AraC-like DNA-binding protein
MEEMTASAIGVHADFRFPTPAPVVGWLHTQTLDSPTVGGADFHEALEFGIVLAGETERAWGGFQTMLRRGEVWMCGMWEPHSWRYASRGTRTVAINFLPYYLIESVDAESVPWPAMFREAPADRAQAASQDARAALLEAGEHMAREIAGMELGWSDALRAHLLRCFKNLSAGWAPHTQSGGVVTVARIGPALARVSSERGRVRLRDAAEACRLSRTRFSALFTQAIGMSFGRFCRQARLGHAARLLLQTEVPLDSIAEGLRFCSPQHLHRAFTTHFGCTPGAFRRQHRAP